MEASADLVPAQPAAPSPPTPVAGLLLYSTMDGPGSVSAPSPGAGAGSFVSTSPTNDFVTARRGAGLRTNAIAERVLFRQKSGSVQNIELERGSMQFWYRPNYNHNNNVKYAIAGTGNWSGTPAAHGSLHLGKHNKLNQNRIFLIYYDGNGVRWEHSVLATAYSWKAGQWMLVHFTWDFRVAAGVRNIHLYLNGAELPLTGQVARGPQPVPAERSSEMIYIGSRDLTGSIAPNGLYDDVRIWNRVVPPT